MTDQRYLRLVMRVLNDGKLKPTRAKVNGKNIGAYSIFGEQARFKFDEGFPILTTKKINFEALAHELIWFLRGDSNIKYLWDNNVHIWDQWADKNGELGYGTYGTMWRKYPFVEYDTERENQYIIHKSDNPFVRYDTYRKKSYGTVDQLARLICEIEEVKRNPEASCGRRLIVNAWHPYHINFVGLPPCHVLYQFSVYEDQLSLQLYQRSCDLFLGVPFNISSYCLLLSIIAKITDLKPYEFIHTYGDLHIYENHVDQCREQLTRPGYALPKLEINLQNKTMAALDMLHIRNIGLKDYKHDPYLKGEIAV